MTMGERKCFAIGQDGAKTEVPCGGGKGKGKPAAKAKLIHAILHRLQMAAARVHSLPTVRSLSLSLDSLSLSLDSFHRNRRYPTHVPCSLMAGIQGRYVRTSIIMKCLIYISLLHSTPSHSVSLSSTPFSLSLSLSLSLSPL